MVLEPKYKSSFHKSLYKHAMLKDFQIRKEAGTMSSKEICKRNKDFL